MSDFLKTLSDKLSSYSLFNFIFPGLLFLGLIKYVGKKDIIFDENIWWFLLAAYSCGMVISRIGSLIVEELFKKLGWIKKYDVQKYSESLKHNAMTGILLEICNTYRTLCAMWFVLFVLTMFADLDICRCKLLFMEAIFTILFAFSFVKQYNYFTENINC